MVYPRGEGYGNDVLFSLFQLSDDGKEVYVTRSNGVSEIQVISEHSTEPNEKQENNNMIYKVTENDLLENIFM